MKALLIVACISLLAACSETPQESEAIYKAQKACIDSGMYTYFYNGHVVCEPYNHPVAK